MAKTIDNEAGAAQNDERKRESTCNDETRRIAEMKRWRRDRAFSASDLHRRKFREPSHFAAVSR